MHILRAADRVATAWKNGGGITREIASYPPASGLDQFAWRVSMASVSRGGPFSVFPGIDRELVVLQGALKLRIAGRGEITFDERADAVRFPGDVPTEGEPVGGLVTDFNVMTRRGQFTSRTSRLIVKGSHELEPTSGTTFVLALAPVTLFAGGAQHWVKVHDVVCLENEARGVSLRAHAAPCVVTTILAAS